VIAWTVGLIVYLVKRHRRRERRAAGLEESDKQVPDCLSEKVIIPPDPAMVGGKSWPGVEPVEAKRRNEQNNDASAHRIGNRGEHG
jgi:hypothetical protein